VGLLDAPLQLRHRHVHSGVPQQDDYGITVANAWRDNARRWKVPLYIGEWISFTTGRTRGH
jgi:hypothetical protein